MTSIFLLASLDGAWFRCGDASLVPGALQCIQADVLRGSSAGQFMRLPQLDYSLFRVCLYRPWVVLPFFLALTRMGAFS